jgi:putative addiction module CopG family antidote
MSATPKSLNVSLSQELTRFINSRDASGRYRSVSGVVRAGLRLQEREEAGLRPDGSSEQLASASGRTADE